MIRFLLALSLCATIFATVVQAGEIKIAVLAFEGSERAASDFEPTVKHLSQALPQHRFVLVPLDLVGMEKAARTNSVDFLITNPGNYIDLEGRFGITRVATLESREHDVPIDTVGSTVIVPNRSGHATTFKDLTGARMAVVARDAFGGWQVAWREMGQAGFSARSLADMVETGFPMRNVIAELRAGRADAGVLRTCLLEEEIAKGHVSPDEFVVVAEQKAQGFPCRRSSRLYPDWAFARLAGTSADLAKSVTARLLDMAPANRSAWTAPQDYNAVHDLFRDLKIGPYEYLAQVSLMDFVRTQWHWFGAAIIGLAWGVFHVVRVEVLVRRRTAQLMQEIQERAKAEELARLHRQERDQFSRLGILGEMASNIAHELNQPLAAISNYAEGMTRLIDADRIDPSVLRDGTRGIAGQAERAGAIIRRIRSFVRRRELRRERFDMKELVREALALFEASAKRSNVPVHADLPSALPQIKADRIEIEQVLLNLLQNAVDSMVESQRQELGIAVSMLRQGDSIEISVRDHGTGLTPEVKERLFETFFTTKPQGLGLGLSICRTIIENHGGRLWALNEATGGLTMRFTLPLPPEHRK